MPTEIHYRRADDEREINHSQAKKGLDPVLVSPLGPCRGPLGGPRRGRKATVPVLRSGYRAKTTSCAGPRASGTPPSIGYRLRFAAGPRSLLFF